ncbi:MAG: DUF4139 domain-containing protein [Candidatus Zixiibacteriota bacterium]
MAGKLLIGLMLWLTLTGIIFANDISVTVYNNNLGVVHETRSLEFTKGLGKLSFKDVPSSIDATSVGFKIADPKKSAVILEQNYAYDLVSSSKIYAKYIDKNIDLFDKDGNAFIGQLLSYGDNSFVIKDNIGGIKVIRADQIVNANFPDLPDGLITRPTLFWLYNSDFTGSAKCEVSYQTSGIDWSAEYVGILSEDEKTLNLTGWSSINNRSGATYTDAKLKLVAGDINRAQKPIARRGVYEMDLMAAKAPAQTFEEKEFFEYHLYTLPRKTTLADNEIKQIALFDPSTAGVEKKYYYQPNINNEKVKVAIEFKNSKTNGLGMPLPAGRTRLFKADSDGSMILLGEDRIEHTPKDEDVKITVGYAFDIASKETATDYQKISNRIDEQTFEIELRNHKSEDVNIIVEKNLYGDWEIAKANHDYNKKDVNTLEFKVAVGANETKTINFTVRTTR